MLPYAAALAAALLFPLSLADSLSPSRDGEPPIPAAVLSIRMGWTKRLASKRHGASPARATRQQGAAL